MPSSSTRIARQAEREDVVKAAAPCWIPTEDIRASLNNLPGPTLTKTDVEQRLRAIWEECFAQGDKIVSPRGFGFFFRKAFERFATQNDALDVGRSHRHRSGITKQKEADFVFVFVGNVLGGE